MNRGVGLPVTEAEVWREGDVYVSHWPTLDVYSQGPTEDVAVRNLVEALELFLASCYRRGQLDRVLKDCGFELNQNPQLPAPDTQRTRPIRSENKHGRLYNQQLWG